MSGKFKVGPAKTRDGRDAVVYAVGVLHDRYQIHGSVEHRPGCCVVYAWTHGGR